MVVLGASNEVDVAGTASALGRASQKAPEARPRLWCRSVVGPPLPYMRGRRTDATHLHNYFLMFWARRKYKRYK